MLDKILKFRLLILLVLGLFTISCDPDETTLEPEKTATNADVNTWIYENMNNWYLWNEKLPSFSSTDLNLSPDGYFQSLLNEPGEVDRFSWIQESSEELRNSLAGITKVFGLRTRSFYADESRTNIIFAISYTQKGSAADRAGLKRGHVITKVDGQPITNENFRTVLSPSTVNVTYGTYNNGVITEAAETISMTKEVTQLEAVQHHEVIEMGDKKIGYLVYLQFITDSNDDLNKVFGEFKDAGINELVVDLRYNPGGYTSSANLLGSLMLKDLSTDKVFSREVWNSRQTERIRSQSGDDALVNKFMTSTSTLGELNNVPNLQRVYFLVSRNSASSSELVINGIKPFMDVVLIGDNTYGKAVGSITIDDNQTPKRWNWGMQPIVVKTVNAVGTAEYGTKEGFVPNIRVNDTKLPFLPFGDPEETLLSVALEEIVGEEVLAASTPKGRKIKISELEPASAFALSDNPLQDLREMIVD